jgi:hypothetical protein
MVQPSGQGPWLCERLIETTPKCANIGTVQKSIPASHGRVFSQAPRHESGAGQRHSGSEIGSKDEEPRALRRR